MKKLPGTLPLIILIVFMSIFTISLMGQEKQRQILSYSEFIKRVLPAEGASTAYKVILTNGEDVARVEDKSGEVYYARIPANLLGGNPDLADKLVEKNIEVDVKPQSTSGFWGSLFSNFLMPLLLFGFFIFMLRSAGGGAGGAMSFGKSKAKMMDKDLNVTFDDVAGIDESKQELEEVVDFLKNSDKYTSLGAKIPRGVMLVGPPGCGKTLLAKAVAGEAGVPFFTISGSDFVEMFVGVGASRVRDLFDQAKKNAPCIVFIDEIDAVGRARSGMSGGGNDEREQTLNQLLVEMDGFEPNQGIIVLAATNRPDVLDKALLRPGRFDRRIIIDAPDLAGREEILKVHSRGKPVGKSADMRVLAKRTPGFSGADLANLINEAAIISAREDKKEIEMDILEGAIDKVAVGPEKQSKIIKAKDQITTAVHEIGHTLMNLYTQNTDEFHKVTIIPRGMALGLTWSTPEEHKVSTSEKQLRSEMMTLLGGRVAEELIFGRENVTTGASNDMERCTAVARAMITQYGMNQALGIITYGERQGNQFLGQEYVSKNYSEGYAEKIDQEVQVLIETMYQETMRVLKEHKGELVGLSQKLLEKETLDRDEVIKTLDDIKEGKVKFLPFEEFEKIAATRTEEKVKAKMKAVEDKFKKSREEYRKKEKEEKERLAKENGDDDDGPKFGDFQA